MARLDLKIRVTIFLTYQVLVAVGVLAQLLAVISLLIAGCVLVLVLIIHPLLLLLSCNLRSRRECGRRLIVQLAVVVFLNKGAGVRLNGVCRLTRVLGCRRPAGCCFLFRGSPFGLGLLLLAVFLRSRVSIIRRLFGSLSGAAESFRHCAQRIVHE